MPATTPPSPTPAAATPTTASPHEPVRDHLPASTHPAVAPERPAPGDDAAAPCADQHGEDGSLVTEYGLLAILAATIAAAVIEWAGDGAMSTLFNAVMRQAREIVGA